MKKIRLNKYLQYSIGMIVFSLGISLMIVTSLGPTVWDAAALSYQKIVESLNIRGIISSYTMATFFYGVFIVIVVSIMNQKIKIKESFLVLCSAFISGFLINIWLDILYPLNINSALLLIRIFISFLGTIILAIGINLYVKTNLIPNPIDYLMLNYHQRFNLNFTIAKYLTDTTGLLLAIVLGVIAKTQFIGIYTFICMLVLGWFVGYFEKKYYIYFEEHLSKR